MKIISLSRFYLLPLRIAMPLSPTPTSFEFFKIPKTLLAIITICFAFNLTYQYVHGNEFSNLLYNFFGWLSLFPCTLIQYFLVKVYQQSDNRREAIFYLYLIYISAAIGLIGPIADSTGSLFATYIGSFIDSYEIVLWFIILLIIRKRSFWETAAQVFTSTETGSDDRTNIEHASVEESPGELLGIGDAVLDKIIHSIKARAKASHQASSAGLIAMIIIVIIGGGASFGTALFNEVTRVHDLERERQELVALQSNMKDYIRALPEKDSLSYRSLIIKMKAKIDQVEPYDKTLKSIDDKATIRWEDIAMRATIATLTLFLVQVFFQIFKYNQQQSAFLYSKAEAIELHKDNSSELSDLKIKLIDKLENNTKFGKDPSTIIQQVVEAVGKLK